MKNQVLVWLCVNVNCVRWVKGSRGWGMVVGDPRGVDGVLVTAEKSRRVRASLNEQEDQSQSLN